MQTFQQANENSADSAAMLKTIQKCSHCGDETNKGNKYCRNCIASSSRREMCEENKALIKSYVCTDCGIF